MIKVVIKKAAPTAAAAIDEPSENNPGKKLVRPLG